jgi:hypothetical protein
MIQANAGSGNVSRIVNRLNAETIAKANQHLFCIYRYKEQTNLKLTTTCQLCVFLKCVCVCVCVCVFFFSVRIEMIYYATKFLVEQIWLQYLVSIFFLSQSQNAFLSNA